MKHKELGNLIKSEREKRGWEQADLAKRMGVTQQSVSRWEKGDSRPRQDDLSRLVDLFSGDRYVWFTKAGYEFEEPDTALAPYLPLQNLSAENFELFCRDFVETLNPEADVHRYGTQGHKQYGIDLYAQKARTIYDYQCKRHKQFGAGKVREAIKKTTLKAKRHYLLLSRTATPPARTVIQKHHNWTLWDREDISTKVRSLPTDAKIRLVDTYFPGKRKSFLGIENPSPWLTTVDYFLPFAEKLRLFSHGWKLVGRTKELSLLNEFRNQTDSQAIIISGRGGIGKSRLLRAWASSTGKATSIRFVSSGSEVDAQDLESLPTGPAFLVIDDAHDRSDTLLILSGIARVRPEMKVIVSTRPYGVTLLKEDLAKSGVPYDFEKTISLNDLSVEDAKSLAEEVLSHPSVKGDIQYAQRIAEITNDCPLATVIGSRLVGQGSIKPDLLNNDKKFREELLIRFRDVIAGEIGDANAQEIHDLLDFLALVQPFNPSDPQFQKAAEEILGKRFDKVIRHINMLEDTGVLLRRGSQLRIVPDLLADYIRALAAYNEKNQKPTGYADHIFEKLEGELATNLLANISQLDWRLSVDGVRASLLSEVWSNLKEQFRKAKIFKRASILDAVKKVAYYQPGHALDFVRLALAEPTDEIEDEAKMFSSDRFSYQMVMEKIPDVLQYVAYDWNYLTDALDILKELAEKDTRRTNQNPSHPVRILQGIASFEPGKPAIYNDRVADHAIGWLKEPPKGNFSPFDVLDELLKTEGHQTESRGYTLTLKPFIVNAKVVAELRERIVQEALNIVSTRPLNEAMRALKTLTSALSYPMGILGQNISGNQRMAWDPGILAVLEGLKNIVLNPALDPYITVEVRGAVSWHAGLGSERTKPAANEVLKSIPETLDYEVSRAIVDGWGWTFKEVGHYGRSETALSEWRKRLVGRLLEEYKGKLTDLITLLESRIVTLNSTRMARHTDAGPFLAAIMSTSPKFTNLLGEYLLSNPSSPLVMWFGTVVSVMARQDRLASITLAQVALRKDEQTFARTIAWSLGWGLHDLEVVPEEVDIIKSLASSPDSWTRHNIVRAVHRFHQDKKSVALNILLSIDISDSRELANEVLGEFEEKYGTFKRENLTDDQLKRLLNHLVLCTSIDDHNISLFLSKTSFTHPMLTLKMLMDRVGYKESHDKDEHYDPLPFSARRTGAWRFHETVQYEKILRTVRDWATEQTQNWVRHHFGAELFKMISTGFDDITLGVLEEWIMSASEQDLENAATLLREAENTFVWDHQDFVVNTLERAQKFGDTSYKRVSSSLHASVFQGGRSGTPGQPFPEDIIQRDRSQAAMLKLPIGSPAYRFYKMLYEEAIVEIKRHTYGEDEFDDMWN